MPATVLLVQYNGGLMAVVDEGAVAERGRREAYLSLGSVSDPVVARQIGLDQISVFGRNRRTLTADIEPLGEDDTPAAGFGPGDQATVSDGVLVTGVDKIASVTMTEDEDGQPTYATEIGDMVAEAQQRFEQTLSSLDQGTLNGQSKVATPSLIVYQSGVNQSIASLVGTLHTDDSFDEGGHRVIIADLAGALPADGSMTIDDDGKTLRVHPAGAYALSATLPWTSTASRAQFVFGNTEGNYFIQSGETASDLTTVSATNVAMPLVANSTLQVRVAFPDVFSVDDLVIPDAGVEGIATGGHICVQVHYLGPAPTLT